MTCGIYCLTNKTTGKRYIGQSIDIAARWKQHQNCREGSVIGAAIAKHETRAKMSASAKARTQRDAFGKFA